MMEHLSPTLSVIYTRLGLLVLSLLPAPISEGPAQEQQVPDEVRNTKAALATAPMLMLAEELSFGAEESVRALSPDSYQLRVNGEGRVYILDAPKAIVTADEYNEQAPRVWIFEPNGRFTRSIAQGGALRSPRNFAVARGLSYRVRLPASRRTGPQAQAPSLRRRWS